jgi:hypothetical protein
MVINVWGFLLEEERFSNGVYFFFPADPKSNNIRVFAVSPSVKNVRYI